MLTGMAAHGKSFEKALKDAQAKGYAEADPASTVDGMDRLPQASHPQLDRLRPTGQDRDIYVEGITKITKDHHRHCLAAKWAAWSSTGHGPHRADATWNVMVVLALLVMPST